MLRRALSITLLALLLLPAAAMASETAMPREYVTEFFIGLIVLVMALMAVIAGFEASKARRNSR